MIQDTLPLRYFFDGMKYRLPSWRLSIYVNEVRQESVH